MALKAGFIPAGISSLKYLSAILIGSFAAGSSFAQSPFPEREPGLWEITAVQGSPVAAMLEGLQGALQNMPEAQRKQMEEMMAGSGVNMAHPTVVRQCLTPEMIKRELQPSLNDPDMTCSEPNWSGSKTEGTYSMSCTGPDGDWQVQGRFKNATSKSYQSEMTLQGSVDGQEISMDIKHDAKWLGSDCQGVKPLY